MKYSNRNTENAWIKNDIRRFLGLFFFSILVNYFLPAPVVYAWFLGLLFLFLKAKNQNNYFWIVFVLLLISAPGNLFSSSGRYPLPSIPVPGFSRAIFYSEIFIFFAICKAALKPVMQKAFYEKPLMLVVGYSIFLVFYGLTMGLGIFKFLLTIRYFIPMLFLVFISRLVPYHTVPRAIILLFVSSSILMTALLFDRIFGSPVASYLGDAYKGGILFDAFEDTIRTIYGPSTLLLSIIFAMIMLIHRREKIKPLYLYLISFLSAFGIFLSATRGWILAVGVIFVGVSFFQTKKIIVYVAMGVVVSNLIFIIPQVRWQFSKALERVETMEAVVEGDLTLNKSLTRTMKRSPRVMNKFWEKPFLGFGFSDEFYRYNDQHVGNQTLLLNGGVVGYAVYLYFICFLLFSYFQSFKKNNKPMLLFFWGLLALIVIHSTSRQYFGYALNVETAMSISLFLFISDYYEKLGGFNERHSHCS